jgi:hypothetical protein
MPMIEALGQTAKIVHRAASDLSLLVAGVLADIELIEKIPQVDDAAAQ